MRSAYLAKRLTRPLPTKDGGTLRPMATCRPNCGWRRLTSALSASRYAFDLIELKGDDLRRDPLEVRKATLASVLAKSGPGIQLNEHIEGDGPTIFNHASSSSSRASSQSARTRFTAPVARPIGSSSRTRTRPR